MLTKLYKLEHCTYCCQYHVVWTPRYRGRVMADIYIKQELKRIFKFIAKWKGLKILEWHIGDEHVHLYLVIPPKYSVSYILCVFKAKSKRKQKNSPEEVSGEEDILYPRSVLMNLPSESIFRIKVIVR